MKKVAIVAAHLSRYLITLLQIYFYASVLKASCRF